MSLGGRRRFRSGLAGVALMLAAGPGAAQESGARGVIVLPAEPQAQPAVAPAPATAFRPCPRPFATSAATLGAPGFDRAVTAALKRRPDSAVVDMPEPFAVAGDPPAGLVPWLNEVKASGGIVSASEYCRDSRGMFGWLGRMFRAVRGVSYQAVDGYDAVLHVDGVEQKVTQVEFKRRTP